MEKKCNWFTQQNSCCSTLVAQSDEMVGCLCNTWLCALQTTEEVIIYFF